MAKPAKPSASALGFVFSGLHKSQIGIADGVQCHSFWKKNRASNTNYLLDYL